mmetsp:Transcript_44412/g.92504  ORF Transcript_44412/g.92504 Transcript_44412/m.92504 type:complete len:162 (-) Transcript_44412:10-495(-)
MPGSLAGSASQAGSIPAVSTRSLAGSSSVPALPILREHGAAAGGGEPPESNAHFIADVLGSDRKTSLHETLARMKKARRDPAGHLRRSPLQMGCPPAFVTSYTNSVMQPVQKANDPKWSTDLKRLDRNLGQKNKYDVRLTAATPGSMSPEMGFFPKNFLPL